MLKRVILTQDRKQAVIHFNTHSVNVCTDEANVMDLVFTLLLRPFKSEITTYKQYTSSLEDTNEVELKEVG